MAITEEQIRKTMDLLTTWNPLGDRAMTIGDLVQPGDLRIRTANLTAANTKIGDEVKELIDSYLKDTVGFSSMLGERTSGEVAYDNEVIIALRKGLSIKRALELAGEKCPDDALQWDDETIDDIKAHYEYLMNHEDILAKLDWLSKQSK